MPSLRRRHNCRRERQSALVYELSGRVVDRGLQGPAIQQAIREARISAVKNAVDTAES